MEQNAGTIEVVQGTTVEGEQTTRYAKVGQVVILQSDVSVVGNGEVGVPMSVRLLTPPINMPKGSTAGTFCLRGQEATWSGELIADAGGSLHLVASGGVTPEHGHYAEMGTEAPHALTTGDRLRLHVMATVAPAAP